MTLGRSCALLILLFLGCTSERVAPVGNEDAGVDAERPSGPVHLTIEHRWSLGEIRYAVRETGTPTTDAGVRYRAALADCIGRLERRTPMRFIASSVAGENDLDVVIEHDSSGASGSLGFTPGNNLLRLGSGMLTLEPNASFVVCHELGHVLGLSHMHQRADRDRYVLLQQPAWTERLMPAVGIQVEHAGAPLGCIGPYDYESIMHYPSDYSMYVRATEEQLGIGLEDETCPLYVKHPRIVRGWSEDEWQAHRTEWINVCDVPSEFLVPGNSDYSAYDIAAIDWLYCSAEQCGARCAPAERCARAVLGEEWSADRIEELVATPHQIEDRMLEQLGNHLDCE